MKKKIESLQKDAKFNEKLMDNMKNDLNAKLKFFQTILEEDSGTEIATKCTQKSHSLPTSVNSSKCPERQNFNSEGVIEISENKQKVCTKGCKNSIIYINKNSSQIMKKIVCRFNNEKKKTEQLKLELKDF